MPFHLPTPLDRVNRPVPMAWRASHAIDFVHAGAGNAPIQGNPVHHEFAARRRNVAAGDGHADLDRPAMALGRHQDHVPGAIKGADFASAAKEKSGQRPTERRRICDC